MAVKSMSLWLLLLCVCQCRGTFVSEEKRLYRHLMTDYEKSVRPAPNHTDGVSVSFGMALTSLVDLNEEDQTLVITGWKRMQWRDFQLAWDPANFSGITQIRIPASQLWIPDIVPYNSVQQRNDDMFDHMAVVYNNGLVLSMPAVRHTTICPLDLTYFPRDTQTCQLVFGSWAHDGFQLTLDLYEGLQALDLSDFTFSPEWEVINTTGKINVKYYSCCAEPYPDITFKLTVRRRPGYLTCVFVSPAVVMSLLVPTMFVLPSESGEKTTLGIVLLLAMVMQLSMLEGYLPHGHHTMPLLGFYYVICMIMASISLAISAFITSIWYRSLCRRPVPEPLRMVVLRLLGRVLFVTQDDVMNDTPSTRFRRLESSASAEGVDDRDATVHQDAGMCAASEWRQLAVIFDRLCLVVFFVSMVIIAAKMASGK